jgi:predicted acylesterase/phospholipase RssA
VALVAGGGALKAYAFHLGVLQGLVEDGFLFRSGLRWAPRSAPRGAREINLYVGSSAGACIVAAIAGGREVRELRDAVRGGTDEVPRFGYRVLFVPVAPNPVKYLGRLATRLKLRRLRPHHLVDVGGLLTTAGVEKYFRRHVLPTNRFGDLAAELYVAATQVNSSRKVVFGPVDSLSEAGAYDDQCAYYNNVPISQAVAAAVAIPPLFSPYAIACPTTGKRFHYYDGEVRETLSMHVARDAGAEFVIASSIWHPYAYNERVGTLADLGMTTLVEQALHQAVAQKVDRDFEQMRRHDELMALLESYGSEHGFAPAAVAELRERMCRLLHHRPARTLYVTPRREDHEFFFEGSFRFNRSTIDRCIEAGHRAYRATADEGSEFFHQLDLASARQRD